MTLNSRFATLSPSPSGWVLGLQLSMVHPLANPSNAKELERQEGKPDPGYNKEFICNYQSITLNVKQGSRFATLTTSPLG